MFNIDRKLEDVRERLGQLRGLVQYYQSGQDFIHGGTGDEEAESSVAAAADYDDLQARQEARWVSAAQTMDNLMQFIHGDDQPVQLTYGDDQSAQLTHGDDQFISNRRLALSMLWDNCTL